MERGEEVQTCILKKLINKKQLREGEIWLHRSQDSPVSIVSRRVGSLSRGFAEHKNHKKHEKSEAPKALPGSHCPLAAPRGTAASAGAGGSACPPGHRSSQHGHGVINPPLLTPRARAAAATHVCLFYISKCLFAE